MAKMEVFSMTFVGSARAQAGYDDVFKISYAAKKPLGFKSLRGNDLRRTIFAY
jgi:hypothetical protein